MSPDRRGLLGRVSAVDQRLRSLFLIVAALSLTATSCCSNGSRAPQRKRATTNRAATDAGVAKHRWNVKVRVPVLCTFRTGPRGLPAIVALGARRGDLTTQFAFKIEGLSGLSKWKVALYLDADNDRSTGRAANTGGVDYQLVVRHRGSVSMYVWGKQAAPRTRKRRRGRKRRYKVRRRLSHRGLAWMVRSKDTLHVVIRNEAFEGVRVAPKPRVYARLVTTEQGTRSAGCQLDLSKSVTQYFAVVSLRPVGKGASWFRRTLRGRLLAGGEGLAVWDLLNQKVLEGDKPQGARARRTEPLLIVAARGESESRSIWVRASETHEAVTLAAGAVSGKEQPHPTVQVEMTERVPLTLGKGRPRWITDYLWPTRAVKLAANSGHLYWVTIRVPPRTKPGRYVTSLLVSAGGRVVHRIPTTIQVGGWSMPSWPGVPLIARLSIDGVVRGINRRRKLLEQAKPHYDALFVSHGISYRTLHPKPRLRLVGDRLVIDWTAFDRRAEQVLDRQGMPWFQPPHVMRGSHARVRPLLGATNPRSAQYTRLWKEYLRQMVAHFKKRGWYRKMVLVLWDEPYHTMVANMKHLARIALEVDPKLRPAVFSEGIFRELVNLYRIWIDGVPSNFARKRQRAGDQLWMYNLFPRSDSLALATRSLFWRVSVDGIDGLCQWTVNNWRKTPFDLLRINVGGKPIRSVEWALIREGQEDHALFGAVRRLGAQKGRVPKMAAQARAISSSFRRFAERSRTRVSQVDVWAFEKLRGKALRLLERHARAVGRGANRQRSK